MKSLRPYLQHELPGLLLAQFLAAIAALALALIPYLVGRIIDCLAQPQEAAPHLIQLTLCCLSAAFLNYLAQNLSLRQICRIKATLRLELFRHWQDECMAELDRSSSGQHLAALVADIEQMAEGQLNALVNLTGQICSLLAILYFLLRTETSLSLLLFLLSPLALLLSRFIAQRSRGSFVAQVESRSALSTLAQDLLQGLRLLKASAAEASALRQLQLSSEQYAQDAQRATFYASMGNPSGRLINNLLYALMTLLSARLVFQGTLSLGTFTAFLAYSRDFSKPLNELADLISAWQHGEAAAQRLAERLASPVESVDGQLASPQEPVQGAFRFEHVDFAYLPERPLIQKLNLHLKQGQRIAIVGPSGAGKSTLLNLILRFYDPQKGLISLDGQALPNLDRQALRHQYGLILQEAWLASATVRDNIALGAETEPDFEKIQKAAQLAHADELIARLPEGYDTLLENNGARLSQGERQLISLARLFLNPPPILLLDEATSSLDSQTEKKIQAAFKALMQGKTSFIVAHRLATIRDADLILVVRNGQVIEQGCHDELMARGGYYHELYQSQFE